MKTLIWVTVTLLLALGGAFLGWTYLPSLLTPANPPVEPEQDSSPLAVRHRFALSADDVKLDKETPALAVDAAGRLLLAWASQTDKDEYTLFLARSDDMGTTFTAPTAFRKVPLHRHTMRSKDPSAKERTMITPLLPRLVAHGDAITLGWLQPEKDGSRVRFLTATSRDGGVSFGEPKCVHGDEAVRPNYTAMSAATDGSLTLLWLDSRKGTQLPFARVGDAEALVHPGVDGKGVCPCCDVDVIRAPDGATFAAFRNSNGGHRDIYVARSPVGTALAFEPAVCVTDKHWTFDGCPHEGPALAISQDRLHVMWMDAQSGKRQIHLATSALDKLAFEPRKLGPIVEEEQGHPQLTATAAGVLHVVWDQALPGTPPAATTGHQHGAPTGTGRAIVYTCSRDNGATFSTPRLLGAVEGAFQSRPVVTTSADGNLFVAWSEISEEGKSVVVARLSPDAASAASCCDECGCCDAPSRGALLHGK